MANEREGAFVVALAVLAYFGWKALEGTPGGITGATAGSGSSHGRGGHGCGCNADPLQGRPITNGGLVNYQTPVAPAGAVSTTTGLAGGRPARMRSFAPLAAPGSTGGSAGSGAQWQGRNSSTATGMTPRNVPSSPVSPGGAGIWVGNSTVARVRG